MDGPEPTVPVMLARMMGNKNDENARMQTIPGKGSSYFISLLGLELLK